MNYVTITARHMKSAREVYPELGMTGDEFLKPTLSPPLREREISRQLLGQPALPYPQALRIKKNISNLCSITLCIDQIIFALIPSLAIDVCRKA